MIPIDEVSEPTGADIVPFTTVNAVQIAKITQSPLDKFAFTQLLEPPSTYEEALNRPNTEKWIAAMNTQNKTLTLNGTWETITKKTVPIDHKILERK